MAVEISCPNCRYSKQVEEIPPGVRWATCPRCKQRFDFTKGWSGRTEPGRTLSPWERRAETGLIRGIFLTAKQVIFSPREFFRKTVTEGGLREPLAFGILFGSFGFLVELFWQFVEGEGDLSSIQPDALGDYGTGLIFLGAAVLCPLAATVLICLTSLILHLLLTVVGGGKKGFEASLRTVCYSQATQIWALIPYVGAPVATLWLVVVQVIGLREIHEVSYARVLVAFLIPAGLVVAAIMAAGVSLFLLD